MDRKYRDIEIEVSLPLVVSVYAASCEEAYNLLAKQDILDKAQEAAENLTLDSIMQHVEVGECSSPQTEADK